MNECAEDKISVLIVDDDSSFRRQLKWSLKNEFNVIEADSREVAINKWQREQVDVVLCDLHIPPHEDDITEGMAVIEAARHEPAPLPVIIMTGLPTKRSALEAVKRGAYGYFEKDFQVEEVSTLIRQAARLRRLERELAQLRLASRSEKGFGTLVGANRALERILVQARTVASTDVTVLLTGESGTGKGLLARAIHEESPRSNGPFISISCGALPEELIESELFGYEKGAFTGATNQKKGRFELANGGTLFLDEVSEISPAVQVKLLNVLQERTFERLGGVTTLKIDVRLIAATNKDLEREVEAGRFRSDLFYRLNVVLLSLPPLRERGEDIPMLAAHFVSYFAKKHRRPEPTISKPLLELLQEHDWPGNVRELENLMERLVVLSSDMELGTEFLPEKMQRYLPQANGNNETTLEGAERVLRKRMILQALAQEGGSKTAAAARLGISRSYLHRLMSQLEL
jgi:DNA-binding NtrC family response regulator